MLPSLAITLTRTLADDPRPRAACDPSTISVAPSPWLLLTVSGPPTLATSLT